MRAANIRPERHRPDPEAVRRAAGPEVCGAQIPTLTDWPIEQIAQTVQPDDAQQASLGNLKEATAKALEVLQSACPTDLPGTPTARLAAMRKRVEAMLSALGVVRPALERFYGSLTDEQKARFNLITPEAQPARAGAPLSELAQVCAEEAANRIAAPTAPIELVFRLNEEQRNSAMPSPRSRTPALRRRTSSRRIVPQMKRSPRPAAPPQWSSGSTRRWRRSRYCSRRWRVSTAR
jgi:hypothetical protein